MGRFDERATAPRRGPLDLLRWRVLDRIAGRTRKDRKDQGSFRTPTHTPDHALLASDRPALCWLGHASFLFTLGGMRVVVDPIFRERLGPVRREVPPGIELAALPPVDLVLVTHNHWDHMDAGSLAALAKRAHAARERGRDEHAPALRCVAPLGNGRALRAMGLEAVDELDWWQSVRIGTLEVTLVPARHWSMRWPWDRNDALWGGFLVRGPEGTLYHAGDSADFDGFAAIGAHAGGVDWALLPIGGYEPRWFMEPQHIGPEEAVAAAIAVGARHLVPMHWGTFRLTDEPLGEPPARVASAWERAGRHRDELWLLAVGETRALGRGPVPNAERRSRTSAGRPPKSHEKPR